MSTNIYIRAVREVSVLRTGKKDLQSISFNAWQTPTSVTEGIMQSSDKIQAYKAWVVSVSKDKNISVYAEDDFWGDGDFIAMKVINEGVEHIERLDKWLDDCKEDGYEVEVGAW